MWPGHRSPHGQDAAYAHERPAPAFLHTFKERLLEDYNQTLRDPASPPPLQRSPYPPFTPHTRGEQDFPESYRSSGSFYPLCLVEDLPPFPDSNVLSELVQLSARTFRSHAFLRPMVTSAANAPYLTCAIACLGAVALGNDRLVDNSLCSTTAHQASADEYFRSGTNTLTLALEVDNREARNIDILIAGALLETYGVLTSDRKIWKAVNQLHGYIETIAQRLRPHEASSPQRRSQTDGFLPSAERYNGIISHLVLLDCMRAIHLNRTPSYSTQELHMSLPSGNGDFQEAYRSLKGGRFEHADVTPENALLLLCAILSDMVVSIRVFGKALCQDWPHDFTESIQPPDCVAPFSATREARRTGTRLALWLDNWLATFGPKVSSDTTALYFFCRLLLAYPLALDLPRTARYQGQSRQSEDAETGHPGFYRTDIPEEAVRFSWLLLEQITSSTDKVVSPVWLPIIVFYAGLVVGIKIRSAPPEAAGQSGILRSLTLFQSELNNMGWPCCEAMVATLETVMKS